MAMSSAVDPNQCSTSSGTAVSMPSKVLVSRPSTLRPRCRHLVPISRKDGVDLNLPVRDFVDEALQQDNFTAFARLVDRDSTVSS